MHAVALQSRHTVNNAAGDKVITYLAVTYSSTPSAARQWAALSRLREIEG